MKSPAYITHEEVANAIEALFVGEVERRKLTVMLRHSWSVEENPDSTRITWPLLRQQRTIREGAFSAEYLLHEAPDGLAFFTNQPGSVWLQIAAQTMDAAENILHLAEGFHPPTSKKEDGRIPLGFWTNTAQGARSITRRITVPTWEEVAGNYGVSARSGLAKLMHDFEPAHGGQLILWQGPPGTGKTFALRALINEWKKWCKPEYVVDPEIFFGEGGSSYLMSVLMGQGAGGYHSDEDDEGATPQWRLLIFEDTGEILAKDAKQRTGQGLSRLLNVVDGMIGQGLRVLLLITTNEELAALHPAVARPGRCAAQVSFEGLSASESQVWADAHGVTLPREGGFTLAQLFAEQEDFSVVKPQRQAGFRPPSRETAARQAYNRGEIKRARVSKKTIERVFREQVA